MHRSVIWSRYTPSNNCLFLSECCESFKIKEFISIPNNSAFWINCIVFYYEKWEMRNFILHCNLSFISYLSRKYCRFVGNFTIIISFVIRTVGNLAFPVNIVIIQNRISWFIRRISHTYSKTKFIVNHCHISKNNCVPHIKTKCPV